jgi:uncharacterized protein (DUF1810 family)
MSEDSFELGRFVKAQEAGDTYKQALRELRAGRKTTHWIWFVFPQIQGLGLSPLSQRYAISSIEEAAAYLAHPVLGRRLVESVQAVLDANAVTPEAVMGGIDAIKLRSSLTLFSQVPEADPVFARALERYYGGQPDSATMARLPSPG